MSETNGGTREGGPRTLTLAGREVTIEPPSARKASRAFALLRAVSKELPGLIRKWGEFEADYEKSHIVEMDRTEAMRRYGGPQPLIKEGEVLLNEKTGEPLTVASALDSMSDEAWESIGNVYRTRESPDWWMTASAVFSEASETAETNVYRLAALFLIPNEEIKRRRRDGSLDDHLAELADDLLDDAGLDELLELAVVCGEVVDGTFMAKARSLGGRLGNALRLVGLDPTSLSRQTAPETPQTSSSGSEETSTPSSDTPSSSKPISATDSDEPSDGTPTPSSTSPTSSSPPSGIASSSRQPA